MAPTDSTEAEQPYPFYLSDNFTMDRNTAAGEDLGVLYSVDMLGNTRTTWTRGAVEFGDEFSINLTNFTATTITVG